VEEAGPLSFALVKRDFVEGGRRVIWGNWAIGGDSEYLEAGGILRQDKRLLAKVQNLKKILSE